MQRQEPVTIPLGSGPDQATARLLRQATVLSEALNGDTSKAGGMRKARGYARIALTSTTHGVTPEAVFVSVGVDRGELVVVGLRDVYGVAAPTASVDVASLVRRGPSMIGNYREGVIHTASLGNDST